MCSKSPYPDIKCLSSEKIAKKLQDGKTHKQAAFSLALMTVARVLRDNVNEPIESLLTKLEQNSLIETTTKDRVIGRQNSVEEICWCMHDKCPSDLERFLEMLKANEDLVLLVNFINDVTAKCCEIEKNTKGNGTETPAMTSSPSHIEVKIDTDPQCEDQYLNCINGKQGQFQTRVLYTDTEIKSVEQHCILITMEGVDEWDLENLRLDMASGAFKTRLVSWLREQGIDLTDEQAASINVDMEAQLMTRPPGQRSPAIEESSAAGEESKPAAAEGESKDKDKEATPVEQEASAESSQPAEDVKEETKSEKPADAGGADG